MRFSRTPVIFKSLINKMLDFIIICSCFLKIYYMVLIFGSVHETEARVFHINIPEDAKLNFTKLAAKYGRRVEEHYVFTEDGHILTLFHIEPSNRKHVNSLPVFLMHGIVDSAINFIIRGNASLAITLANEGYDVWAGNTRGTVYGRRHLYLDAERDKAYWNFSLHENGLYDVAPQVDYVLKSTGHQKINVIAFSQGNAEMFVLCSTKPEYNEKINVLIALSPIAFLDNLDELPKVLIRSSGWLNELLISLEMEEVISDVFRQLSQIVCSQELPWTYELCTSLISALCGEDNEEIEEEFLHVVYGHLPQPTSRKSLLHISQISLRRRFAQYDYGITGNMEVYNRTEPPDYDLSKVTTKVALFSGLNDKLSTLRDVAKLKRRLPNVVEARIIKMSKWNHLDFVWANHAPKYLHPYVLQILRRYS